MPSKLEGRVAALERQQHSGAPQVIIIRGGMIGGDPTYAEAGELRFERPNGESFQTFEARAVAEAKAAGERFVVIGGLHIA
jgi:hypothetical protein